MPDGRPGFGARLAAARAAKGSLCVGIDPHPALLSAWGLNDDAAGVERFSLTALEAVSDSACMVKPQVAFFERHGSAGMAALERLLARAAEAQVLTLADAKRGDIGSTMEAYAAAWLRDGSPLAADAVTLSPYLGFESLRPALTEAAESGRGVFVLALTSNPEGASVQHASVQHTGGFRSVARSIADAAAGENAGATPDAPGSVGLVVGATVGSALRELGMDLAGLNGPILAPGIGAQGAGAGELDATFGAALPLVVPSSSRAILQAGPSAAALRRAAERAREDLGV